MAFMDLARPRRAPRFASPHPISEPFAEDQVGNLQIRGACVMAGYMCHPTANAECLVEDNWLDSGDLGFIHKGRLALTGRAKEMVITFGANYYCYEVESVASRLAMATCCAWQQRACTTRRLAPRPCSSFLCRARKPYLQ